MKKITLLLFVIFVSCFVYAGGDWAPSVVSITKNDDVSAYLYVLNNQGWTDGSWGGNTAFNNYDFGTPSKLTLNGGSGNAWADGGDYYDGSSFVIYYRVYRVGDTPGSWTSISLANQSYHYDNNYIYDKSDANVDILNLATVTGTNTYTLEVVMTKNQFYSGGNWNSMVPGGQSVGYNASTSGYKATFNKTVILTDTHNVESSLKLSGSNGRVTARFDGSAKVELYTVAGQLIRSENAVNEFSQSVKSGMYLLRVNGKAHKVVVD